ncbi:tryptophan--tRNA ligase [Calderihabitans maritimus]|uniref:Tryptophan--tRNA ligase n=1 Tax=Calderihabitans maritimus TaxID=1246530 RepID=A0A1Z5HXA3_9FIRM|nr:tryptophan--tRNA ligase [Calderihabitans maritimus]GAW93910.1 tryptophanyl-tRNA synthetase [Calderihabitans maritimus]
MKGRILSGMRPTGKLHIGHLSVLENWVRFQDEYECFYTIVDWHALTTAYDDTSAIKENVREMLLDWLSVGLDPEKSTIFLQSDVKEHAELYLLFAMITPLSWLERCPTYKDQVQQLGKQGKDISTYGFLGYPLLQAADILVYKADTVPVGEDQLPHLELCREIARRFNFIYKTELFPEPQAKLSRVPLLPGIDARKMSKSYGNEIPISATREEIFEKVRMMVTDPGRIRRHDPGNPEVCVVHTYNQIYNPEEVEERVTQCRQAEIGCVACKKRLAEKLDEALAPYREKRAELAQNPALLEEILEEGARRARAVASETMKEVREAMKI